MALKDKRKWLGTRAGLEMGEKAASVQREILKDLQKAWEIMAQEHFKTL